MMTALPDVVPVQNLMLALGVSALPNGTLSFCGAPGVPIPRPDGFVLEPGDFSEFAKATIFADEIFRIRFRPSGSPSPDIINIRAKVPVIGGAGILYRTGGGGGEVEGSFIAGVFALASLGERLRSPDLVAYLDDRYDEYVHDLPSSLGKSRSWFGVFDSTGRRIYILSAPNGSNDMEWHSPDQDDMRTFAGCLEIAGRHTTLDVARHALQMIAGGLGTDAGSASLEDFMKLRNSYMQQWKYLIYKQEFHWGQGLP